MSHTKSNALVVLGDSDTEGRAQMLAARAAEHGMVIARSFAFGVGEVISAGGLAEVEQVIAALSHAIATGREIWVPFWREDLGREEHLRRLSLVLQRHGLNLRLGPQLTTCPTKGGYSAIDIALRAEVRAVDGLDHAALAAAGAQTLSAEIELALSGAGTPSRTDAANPDVTYFQLSQVAGLFQKSQRWLVWALRHNVFVRKDGSRIDPVRGGDGARRGFTLPLLRDMAEACYRRGILDELELKGVLGELARAQR